MKIKYIVWDDQVPVPGIIIEHAEKRAQANGFVLYWLKQDRVVQQ